MVRPGRASSSARWSWPAFVTSTRSPPPQAGGGGEGRLGGVVPVVSSGADGTVVGVPDALPEGLDGPSDSQELSVRRSTAASTARQAALLPGAGPLERSLLMP